MTDLHPSLSRRSHRGTVAIVSLLAMAGWLGIGSDASGQSLPTPATKIYRLVTPDGRIIYADRPLAGNRVERTIAAEQPAPPAPRPIQIDGSRVPSLPPLTSGGGHKPTTAAGSPMDSDAAQAGARVVEAETKLAQARERRTQGMEPLPGERTGMAGGGSRLNERYFVRQKQLEQDVADAEEALAEASRR